MSDLKKIGAVISLDGEKEYRKALQDIKTDQSLLRSEMVLAKTEYEKNGRGLDDLRKIHDNLGSQVDKQREKVDLLKQAVANATEKYGDNDKKVKEWQQRLNYAQGDLNNLETEFKENKKALEEAETQAGETTTAISGVGSAMDDTKDKSGGFRETIAANLTLTDIINGLKTAAGLAKAAWDEVYAIARDAAAYADDILTISSNTGIAISTLQELKAAEPYIDVPLDTITGAITRNTKAMGEAKDGSDKYKEAYEKLGVKIEEKDGTLRNSEDVFWDVVDALGDVENKTLRDTIAMELFGRKATDLTGLIKTGKDGLKEYTDQAEDMGLILDEKAITKLGEMDDSFQKLDQATESLKNNAAVLFAPAITLVVDSLSELFGNAAKWLSTFGDDYKGELQVIHEESERLSETIKQQKEDFDAQKESIEADNEYVIMLADSIFRLSEESGLSATQHEMLKIQIQELNTLVPDLGLKYDEQTGKLNLTRQEVDSLTESYKKQAIQMAYQEQLTQISQTYAEALRNNALAEIELNKKREEGHEAINKVYKTQAELIKDGLSIRDALTAAENQLTDEEWELYAAFCDARDVQKESNGVLGDAQKAMDDLETEMNQVYEALGIETGAVEESTEATEKDTEAVDKNKDAKDENKESTDDLKESTDESAEAMEGSKEAAGEDEKALKSLEEQEGKTEEATDNATESADDHTEALGEMQEESEDTREELSDLEKAIQEYAEKSGESAESVSKDFSDLRDAFVDTYNSAKDSIDKQVGLFADLKTEATKSDQEMLDTLLNQNVTLEQWSEDIKALAKAGLEDGLLQQLIDAGPAGAADVRSLAKHVNDETDTFISEMNTAYREQMKIKEAFATEMAESETNFLAYSESIGIDAETLRAELAAKGVEIGDDYTSSMQGGINSGAPDVASETEAMAKDAAQKASEFEEAGIDSAKRYTKKLGNVLDDGQVPIALKLGNTASLFRVNGEAIEKRGTEGGEKYVNSLTTQLGKTQTIQDGLNAITALAQGQLAPMQNAGAQLGNGVIDGLKAALSARYWEVDQAVNQINARARQAMQIHSPSRVMMQTGAYIGEGLIEGTVDSIEKGLTDITEETNRLSDALAFDPDEIEQMSIPDLTLDGGYGSTTNNETTNYGGININVYGNEGQSEREIAEYVIELITDRQKRESGVWG